jgi:hypothetical protein
LYGAVATLLGAVLSGPVAMAIVEATHPQPARVNARVFADNYHAVQALPFVLGFLLVSGFVILIASIHAMANAKQRVLANIAIVLTTVFAAFVFMNYVLHTTVVPALAREFHATNGPLVEAFSLSNPRSLGWALEMWGYGFLGAATWLVSPVFSGSRLERATAWTFAANGPASIVPAVWTAVQPGWVMTPAGFLAFAVWNALVVVMAALAIAVFGRRLRETADHAPLTISPPRTLTAGAR